MLCFVCGASCHLAPFLPARCAVLGVRCTGPLGSFSLPFWPAVLCCSVCCDACAVSWATWLLYTGVLVWCVVSRVWCPGLLSSCSPVCSLGVLCCVCRVLVHFAPVQRSARSVRCVVCAVSWNTWLLFTGVLARCVALRVCGALVTPFAHHGAMSYVQPVFN